MPRAPRKTARKPRAKRTTTRYRRQPLMLSGFPEKKIVKLRYVESIYLNSSSSNIQTYAFSCNSLYDPNRTGTGHQPMYYDTYAAIYNHYKVLGSKMQVHWSIAGSAQTGTICGVKIDDDLTTFTGNNIDALMEQKDTKYQVVVAQSAPRKTISKWSLKKEIGSSNSDTWGAQVGSSPSDEEFFIIYASSADRTTGLGQVACTVIIDYIAQFYEMQTAPQS